MRTCSAQLACHDDREFAISPVEASDKTIDCEFASNYAGVTVASSRRVAALPGLVVAANKTNEVM